MRAIRDSLREADQSFSANRRIIEDACKEFTGRKITLSILVGEGSNENEGEVKFTAAKDAKQRAENHPALAPQIPSTRRCADGEVQNVF